MKLEIEVIELPPIGTNCVFVSNPETQETAVFDAPMNAFASTEPRLVNTGRKLTGAYMTHGHWDHTLDGWRFSEAGYEVFGHKGDQFMFEEPEHMRAFSIPNLEMKPVQISNWVAGRERISIVGRTVEVRHVPGHSPGSVLYWFVDDGFAVSGDAIFNGSVGRTDFPGCSFEELEASIQNEIYTLPDETRLLCGHGPETSVAQEKSSNPFVRTA